MIKKFLSGAFKMLLCFILYFVFMYVFVFIITNNEINALNKIGVFYPASLIFELFCLFSYFIVFKKSIKGNVENDKFIAKNELMDYYNAIGKYHLIFYSAFFVIGIVCTALSLNVGAILTLIIPLTGVFADYMSILGIIMGYIIHILALSGIVLAVRYIAYKKRND